MILRGFGLPLLTKELAEQSARPRTYIIRAVYACILYAIGFAVYAWLMAQAQGSVFAALGSGRRLYDWLVRIQLLGIYLFMPALTCGAIAGEKERNTFVTLIPTRLGPTTILLEKFLSRLVPMLMFNVLCLPLLAIAYSLGGITQHYMWLGVFVLLVTMFQVGSLSMLCSAYCRTSVSSFMAVYIWGFLILVAGPIAVGIVSAVSWRSRVEVAFSLLPFRAFTSAQNGASFALVVADCVPLIGSGVMFLLLARFFVLRRAFVQPRNMLVVMFRHLDTFFKRVNENQLTRGVVLVRESQTLPDLDPLAWRAVNKSALGAFRYLVRLFVAIEFPVAFLCTLMAVLDLTDFLGYLVYIVWAGTVLLLIVNGCSLITGERTRETLDVLLASPMTGASMIRQKLRGTWRLCAVLAVPLVTVIAFKTWWISGIDGGWFPSGRTGAGHYLIASMLAIAVYLPLFTWLSVCFGLWFRSQVRAIFAVLATVVIWSLPAIIVSFAVTSYRWQMNSQRTVTAAYSFALPLFMSPASIIPATEGLGLHFFLMGSADALVIVNYSIHAGIACAFRLIALRHADYFLGRLEVPTRLRSTPSSPVGLGDAMQTT